MLFRQAVFEVSMHALKLLDGRIEAVNCVCGRQLFGPFSDKIPVFCVLTTGTLRLLPVTRSAPRYGEKWEARIGHRYGTDGTLGNWHRRAKRKTPIWEARIGHRYGTDVTL